ncbi:MAG: S46 family peptidase, partial [Bacteroidota bacterium]
TDPRYSLDFALFRAYGDDGEPIQPEVYFPFEPEGTDPGDLVFVIGNPGSTTRLNTVAELTFRRDVREPALLNFLTTREAAYGAYLAANPDDPLYAEFEDTFFSLGNGRKAYTGRVEGLRDPYILARRAAAERDYLDALRANAEANGLYGDVVDRIADNRQRAMEIAPQVRAFFAFGPGSPYNGTALNRGLAYVLSGGEASAVLDVEDQPEMLQELLLAARFADVAEFLGSEDPLAASLLVGQRPEQAAAAVIDGSAFTSRESTQEAFDSGADLSQDPAVLAANAFLPALRGYSGANQALQAELNELQTALARSRFEIYGTSIPPDATFSLRISDGVVKSYPYNGTVTPPYTTFYGLYDRYFSHCAASGDVGEDCDWFLPERWTEIMGEIDLSTPYNFVSTNDIIGGNSGSPVLNRDLEVVGIAFDGNINGLPGDYIFDDTLNRTVSVDVRAMLLVLQDVYNLDYLVDELTD